MQSYSGYMRSRATGEIVWIDADLTPLVGGASLVRVAETVVIGVRVHDGDTAPEIVPGVAAQSAWVVEDWDEGV